MSVIRPSSQDFLQLRAVAPVRWSPARQREPVSIGIPFAEGVVSDGTALSLTSSDGVPSPLQVRALDRWHDGSIRWGLFSAFVDAHGSAAEAVLRIGGPPAEAPPEGTLRVSARPEGVRIDTGAAVFTFAIGARFPVPQITGAAQIQLERDASGLSLDIDGTVHAFTLSAFRLIEQGPVRAEIELHAASTTLGELPLEVVARAELFAGSGTLRLQVTLRNRRRAVHANGQWGLGDPGSVLIRSLAVVLTPAEPVFGVEASVEAGQPLTDCALPFSILQESSGGTHWDSRAHVDRDGKVPLRFRGYRCQAGGTELRGDRATPIVVARTAAGDLAVAVPRFWETFPNAISVTGAGIDVALLPADSATPHELQGGEQTTRTVVLAFSPDTVADPPLAWVHEPLLLGASPEWTCATGAVPFLIPADGDPNHEYAALAAEALDPAEGFFAKRERADEYGWRHFGDLPADHESAFQPADRAFVSHYNNQYDAVAGFALQYLRTGDQRWWTLMDDLARHVRDIDIYHTTEDKSAYNGGLFWHTAHYVDAGTSTHRTYPPGSNTSGGPSAEHNYNVGLMLHFFLTGDEASREAAIGLGQWVLNMDDGRQTVLRALSTSPTGHASFTNGYYGPGRGAGHSIFACVVAHRLSGNAAYLAKADELIRRTAHPADDIDRHTLLDAELRWSYTAFLQAVATYVFHKLERRELDDAVAYARCTLLHYARWMREHERPYLEHPDRLEYPTETWAAQDVRKGDVLLWAALFADASERAEFLDRARFFFDDALTTLARMPTRRYTRPVVIVLSHAIRRGWLLQHPDPDPLAATAWPSRAPDEWPRTRFVPQKAEALSRARIVAVVGGLLFLLAALLALNTAW